MQNVNMFWIEVHFFRTRKQKYKLTYNTHLMHNYMLLGSYTIIYENFDPIISSLHNIFK